MQKQSIYVMRKHHLSFILFFLFVCVGIQSSAQTNYHQFSLYSDYLKKVFDISLNCPKGFVDLQTSEFWGPNGKGKGKPGMGYTSILESKKGDCMIMYADIQLYYHPQRLQLNVQQLMKSDSAQDIIVLTDKDVTKYSNADTVFLAKIPLHTMYKDKYSHCIGVYICKANRPEMYFKCFFTEKGKQDENHYLTKLLKSVRYRGNHWVYDLDKSSEEAYKLYLKRRE